MLFSRQFQAIPRPGGTILTDVEVLPDSLLFWRSSTHFIGGLGVVVFLLLIIPSSSPMRLRLTNMEVSSLSREGYKSRTNKTVWIFAAVYLGLAVVSFLSYWAAGMSAFDAINHAFSVISTGGFSTKNLSIASFDSNLINILTIIFMFFSSVHFGLIYMVFATRSLRPLNNPVLKFYVLTILIASLLVALSLKMSSAGFDLGRLVHDRYLSGCQFHIDHRIRHFRQQHLASVRLFHHGADKYSVRNGGFHHRRCQV